MTENPYREIETGRAGEIGWRIHYFPEIDSTQNAAREMAEQGSAHGTVLIAETQTAGRGRMGRSWHSPMGVSLYSTIILRPQIPIAEVSRLSLVAGVAAADAIALVAPGIVALKWPNDIWLRGKKTGGIIAEAVTNTDGSLACVLLGIGINVNLAAPDIPEELRDKATSLRIATGHPCDRIELARSLFSILDSRYRETIARGFAELRPAWESYSALTGKRVAILDSGRKIAGVVRGIDASGALMLATEAGIERIVAGEVSVEGAYS